MAVAEYREICVTRPGNTILSHFLDSNRIDQ